MNYLKTVRKAARLVGLHDRYFPRNNHEYCWDEHYLVDEIPLDYPIWAKKFPILQRLTKRRIAGKTKKIKAARILYDLIVGMDDYISHPNRLNFGKVLVIKLLDIKYEKQVTDFAKNVLDSYGLKDWRMII